MLLRIVIRKETLRAPQSHITLSNGIFPLPNQCNSFQESWKVGRIERQSSTEPRKQYRSEKKCPFFVGLVNMKKKVLLALVRPFTVGKVERFVVLSLDRRGRAQRRGTASSENTNSFNIGCRRRSR